MSLKRLFTTILLVLFFALPSYNQILSCSECSSRILNDNDIKDMSLEELNLLRNEIYARKGYQFDKAEYSRYFENQNWYKQKGDNSQIILSEIEKQNVDFLKSRASEINRRRNLALTNLKELKNALNTDDSKTIEKYLPKGDATLQNDYEVASDLRAILNKTDLDDIHWNKKYGMYKVSIDNGYAISYYMICFEKNTIRISGSDMSEHSEIFGDFDDGYSDYMSENEWAIFYLFDITENGIKYKDVQFAG